MWTRKITVGQWMGGSGFIEMYFSPSEDGVFFCVHTHTHRHKRTHTHTEHLARTLLSFFSFHSKRINYALWSLSKNHF